MKRNEANLKKNKKNKNRITLIETEAFILNKETGIKIPLYEVEGEEGQGFVFVRNQVVYDIIVKNDDILYRARGILTEEFINSSCN